MQIDLEHAYWVWSQRTIKDFVDSDLGDFCLVSVRSLLGKGWCTFSSYAFVQLCGKLCLLCIRLHEVDMNIEATSRAIVDRIYKGRVRSAASL